jgi:hypothetical protein
LLSALSALSAPSAHCSVSSLLESIEEPFEVVVFEHLLQLVKILDAVLA